MPDDKDIEDRVRARVGQGEFLANLLRVAATASADVQEHFVTKTSEFTRQVRAVLDARGLIQRIAYEPRTFWPSQRGKTFGFIDAGVANVEIPTSAPIGIRVGNYIVRPGDTSDKREEFGIELAVMDEMFAADSGLFTPSDDDDDSDPFEDLMKMRDAARIMSETAAALRIAERMKGGLDALLVHGPLINPAAPYGLANFPPLNQVAAREMLGAKGWSGTDKQRLFVHFELLLLQRLKASGVPVVGVVERSKAGKPVLFRMLLEKLTADHKDTLRTTDADELLATAKAFALDDTTIFDLVLTEGEYLKPLAVSRQGEDKKWPVHNDFGTAIANYPKALTTFVKPGENGQPFRVEGFEGTRGFDDVVGLVVHTSRLLPSYVFPVGLDIVDRYAKVPAWLSSGVRSRHQMALLRKALESGDQRVLTYAKRVLASKGRDWLFRPTI